MPTDSEEMIEIIASERPKPLYQTALVLWNSLADASPEELLKLQKSAQRQRSKVVAGKLR